MIYAEVIEFKVFERLFRKGKIDAKGSRVLVSLCFLLVLPSCVTCENCA